MIPTDGGGHDAKTQELVREVGRRSVVQLVEGVTRMVGESSALSRWLLTMLVALNGAALAYCVTRTAPIAAGLLGAPAPLFFSGMLIAVLAAFAGLILTVPVTSAMRGAVALWTEVSTTGTLTDDALAAARRVRRMGLIWMGLMALMALLSLLLFLLGALTVAGYLPAAQPLAVAPPPLVANAVAPLANAMAPPAPDGDDGDTQGNMTGAPVADAPTDRRPEADRDPRRSRITPVPSPSPRPTRAPPRRVDRPAARSTPPAPRRTPTASPSPPPIVAPTPAPSVTPPAPPILILPSPEPGG